MNNKNQNGIAQVVIIILLLVGIIGLSAATFYFYQNNTKTDVTTEEDLGDFDIYDTQLEGSEQPVDAADNPISDEGGDEAVSIQSELDNLNIDDIDSEIDELDSEADSL